MKPDVPLREGYDTPARGSTGRGPAVFWQAEDVRVTLVKGHPPLIEMGLPYGLACDCGGTVVCVTWTRDGRAKVLRNCAQCGKDLEPLEHRLRSHADALDALEQRRRREPLGDDCTDCLRTTGGVCAKHSSPENREF